MAGPGNAVAMADIDDMALLATMEETLGPLGAPWVRTGSGKVHIFKQWRPGLPARIMWEGKRCGDLLRGPTAVDEEKKQQTVLPPSVHPDSLRPYEWSLDPITTPLEPWPSAWVAYFASRHVPLGHRRPPPSTSPIRTEALALALAQPGAHWSNPKMVKFQCAGCAREGHDKHEDNAAYFPITHGWGCAWSKDDPILGLPHWNAIGYVLGILDEHGHARARSTTAPVQVVEEPDQPGQNLEPPPPPPDPPYTFKSAVPADHFVRHFITYGAACTDAPHEFLETTALIMLATATPGVRARLGPYPRGLPTSFYAIQIADSTRSRKSTSAGLGIDVLEDAVPLSRLSEMSTPEAFIEQIAERNHNSALWYQDEIGETIDKLHHAKYMAGLRGLLLQLYEGRPFSYRRTKKRGKDGSKEVDEAASDRPHLCVLGSTTPSIFEIITSRDIGSGFMARFAVVMPTVFPPRRKIQQQTVDLSPARLKLVMTLMDLNRWSMSSERKVDFEDTTLDLLDAFAAEIETSTALDHAHSRAMLQRLNAMSIKLAMLVAAGRPGVTDGTALVVRPEDAEAALVIATRWRDYAVTFGQKVGENALEQLITRLLQAMRLIAKKTGSTTMRRRAVAKNVKTSWKLMNEAESTMRDRGDIEVEDSKGEGKEGPIWTLLV